MYRPKHFKVDELKLCQDLIRKHPLGTLVTPTENSLQMNYLPFLLEQDGDKFTLISHIARANPHLACLEQSYAVISFQGPDRYISPSWYQSNMEVPTWNYAAVQVRGRVDVLNQYEDIESILQQSAEYFEKNNNTSWSYTLPEKFRRSLIQHIAGIRIHIESIEGKFKLSQNRNPSDQQSVKDHLANSPHSSDHDMLQMMQLPPKTTYL